MIALRTALLCCLLASLACHPSQQVTGPSGISFDPLQPLPSNSIVNFAPLAGTPFVFSAPSSYPVRDYTTDSRFVISDDGRFTLQYVSLGKEYAGTYEEDNGRFAFRFSSDFRWTASGTLSGNSLEVHYNVVMELSDFENAVYKRP